MLIGCKHNNVFTDKPNTKIFGDTLLIEYTYKGDTIYQKRTNLKWKKGSKQDKSYFIKSIWSTRFSSKLNCNQKLIITKNNMDYSFCLDDILLQTQQQLKKEVSRSWQKDSILKLQKELIKIENGEIETITSKNFFMLFDFIKNIDFEIFDNPSNSKISKVRVEHYETNFSNGNIYYLINKKLDTIAKYNIQNWSN